MTAYVEGSNEFVCVGCFTKHESSPLTDDDKIIDPPNDGWLVPFAKLGYYSGFNDHFLSDEWDNIYFVCHDCCVKIVTLLPGIHSLMRGGHPGSLDAKPCCNYAWTYDFETETQYRPWRGEWFAEKKPEGDSDE